MNFVKFLRAPLSQNTSWGLFFFCSSNSHSEIIKSSLSLLKYPIVFLTKFLGKSADKNKKQPSIGVLIKICSENMQQTPGEKCPPWELFWSVFSRIRTEYRKIQSISPYSVWMREDTDQNNSKYRHFSRSEIYRTTPMPKCDFNKVAKQFYWNHTSAWVFSCNFATYF